MAAIIGTVIAYMGLEDPAPANGETWMICDGRKLPRYYIDKQGNQQPTPLFALIQETYGSGDNSSTYNIPDLQGRFIRGLDFSASANPNSTGRDPDLQLRTAMNGGGNTGANVGSVQADTFGTHQHSISDGVLVDVYDDDQAYAPDPTQPSWGTSDVNGDAETRPANAYVNFLIRIS